MRGVILIAFAVSALAAVSGTLLSVVRAARLPPAEGMRPEMPTTYRTTLVERIGLQRWFAAPTRMILRHIERRPLKSLLTVLGIACACGLMMVGNYQKGAIDFMVDVQFRQASREDLALDLHRAHLGPRAARTGRAAGGRFRRRLSRRAGDPALRALPLPRRGLRHPAARPAAPLARPQPAAGRACSRAAWC